MKNKLESELFYEDELEKYAGIKDYRMAIYYCDKLLQLYPNDVDFLFNKSQLLYKNHEFHKVLETLELLKNYDIDRIYAGEAEILYYSCVFFMI